MHRPLLFTLFALLLGACTWSHQAEPSMFDAMGGHDGVRAITEDFIIGLSEDERVGHHFVDTDIGRFVEKFSEQLCVESGGPCRYTGDSMAVSHRGLGISRAEFNITVEILQQAMRDNEVPLWARNRLIARLAPMYGDIVEDPTPTVE